MGIRFIIMIVLGILLLCHDTKAAEMVSGIVTRIIDGDTLTIARTEGDVTTVRLYGIDAPELHQEYGPLAKNALFHFAFGRFVRVVVEGRSYDRLVGDVKLTANETSLNMVMIHMGLAWWDKRYAPKCAACEQAMAYARKNRVGLWQDQDALAPWDFRKGKQ